MARNKLAGTKVGQSKSALFYQNNPSSRKKKKDYDTEFNKNPKQKKKRYLLLLINRDKGTNGNGDGLDESHINKKETRPQKQSKNRGDKKRIFFGRGKK